MNPPNPGRATLSPARVRVALLALASLVTVVQRMLEVRRQAVDVA